MADRGRFITVEGIEGAGKSTQMDAVRAFLDGKGIRVVVTREPGGTALGESVRGLLLGVLQHNVYHAGQIAVLKKAGGA